RLQEEATLALKATGYPDLAKLGCEVKRGVLVLSGFVSSYYLKQLAQEAVLRLKPEHGLRNHIVVS
ncbi:MAG: hypothetical protein AB7F89_03700, partial [Pirellulaceae bacterium]